MRVSNDIDEVARLVPLSRFLNDGGDAVAVGRKVSAGEVAVDSPGEERAIRIPRFFEESGVAVRIDHVVSTCDHHRPVPAGRQCGEEGAPHPQVQIFLFYEGEIGEERLRLFQVMCTPDKGDVLAAALPKAVDLVFQEGLSAEGEERLFREGPEAHGAAGKEEEGLDGEWGMEM